ncbi:hypothetical protein AVEN_20686-1, partial [Araneus ventricosus]
TADRKLKRCPSHTLKGKKDELFSQKISRVQLEEKIKSFLRRVDVEKENLLLDIGVECFPRESRTDKKQHDGYFGTDLIIVNHGQMMRTTHELAPSLQLSAPHQREDVCPTPSDLRCTSQDHIHNGSSVESGFELGIVRFRSRDLLTRTLRPTMCG